MNIYVAVTLGATVFITVFLARAYFVPGLISMNLFLILLFLLAVIVTLVIASN